MHQGDVVENGDVHLAQVFGGGVSKKSSSFVHSMSASPIIAVCITTMSFKSRMGAITRGPRVTISEDRRRKLTYSKTKSSVRS